MPDLAVGSLYVFPVPDWEHTRLLVVLGQNPLLSHGHVAVRPDALSALRSVQGRGGTVVMVDPRLTESAWYADLHLRPRPGTDAVLLAHLVRDVLAHRPDAAYLAACADVSSVGRLRDAVEPFDEDATERRTGVPGAQLGRLRALVRSVPRLSCVTGTGVSMGPTPTWRNGSHGHSASSPTGSTARAAWSSTPGCSACSSRGW